MFTSAQHARCNSHGLSMHSASLLFVVVVRKQVHDIRSKDRWMANIAQIALLSCMCVLHVMCIFNQIHILSNHFMYWVLNLM